MIIYDEEAASFSLKTWRISINVDQQKLVKLLLAPVLPDDAKTLSVLAHEYHHWVSTFCSSYGLLINIFRQQAANEAATLANILLTSSELKKPITISLLENIDNYQPKEEIIQLIIHYESIKELVDLFIGIKKSPYFLFCDLFPDIIDVFQRAKNNLSTYSNSKQSKADIKQSWVTGNNLKPINIDDALFKLLENNIASLTEKQDRKLDLHLQINKFDRINWPIFLEGSAKYFQRAYESVLLSVAKNGTEKIIHNAMHGVKDYEKWNSPYSRLMKVMGQIMGIDYNYCEVVDIITLQALADLAMNPSLDADYFFPNEKYQTMQTLFPGQRFAWACDAAKRTKSIAKRLEETGLVSGALENAYRDFISDCCSLLEWEPPWVQAKRWLAHYPEFSNNNKTGFFLLDHFLEGCRLRLSQPLFFGIPSHAISVQNNREFTWFASLVKNLTIPAFASRDGFPIFMNTKIDSLVLPQQLYAIYYDILDQLMLCPGPLDWKTILESLGNNKVKNEVVLTQVRNILFSEGIDLEKVTF